MRQLQKLQRRKNGRVSLRTPDAWLLMAVAWPLAEDQQERGQKDQKNLLMAEITHVAENQCVLHQIIDVFVCSVEIRPCVAESLDGKIGHGMFHHLPCKIRAERDGVGARQ